MITAKKFKALPENEQRVLVAKDVLSMLKKGKIKPTHEAVLKFNPKIVAKLNIKAGDQLQRHLPNLIRRRACKACAVGSCLISIVGIVNKYKVPPRLACGRLEIGVHGRVKMRECYTVSKKDYATVAKVFGEKTTYMIERIFEQGQGAMHLDKIFSPMMHNIICIAAQNYGKSIGGDKSRLVKIMENIVANDGNLVIPKKFFPKTYCGALINDFVFESQIEEK